jgi:hypothetical protein
MSKNTMRAFETGRHIYLTAYQTFFYFSKST